MRRALPCCVLSFFVAAAPGVVAGELGGIATTATILAQARLDRREVAVERLASRLPAADAAAAIAARWRSGGDPVVGLRIGPWHLVSRLTPQRFDTMQLRDAVGGSEGFLSRWPHASSASEAPRAPWWPASAKPLRTIASRDGARDAVTWIGRADLGPHALRGLIASRLAASGWSVSSDVRGPEPASRPGASGAPAAAPVPLLARRGQAALVVTIEPRADGAAFVAQQQEIRP